MFNYVFGGLVAIVIGVTWVGFHKYGTLKDQVGYLTAKLEKLEEQPADQMSDEGDGDGGEALGAIVERLEKLEAESTAQQGTDDAREVKIVQPEPKPVVVRKFTNQADGKTIDAQLVAVDGTNVTIRRIDGQEFTFPIARLTRDDQVYITEHASSLEHKEAEDSGTSSNGEDLDFGSFFDE